MKFKNKINQEVVEANTYTQVFAYSHNSNWEKIEEIKDKTKKSVSKEE